MMTQFEKYVYSLLVTDFTYKLLLGTLYTLDLFMRIKNNTTRKAVKIMVLTAFLVALFLIRINYY